MYNGGLTTERCICSSGCEFRCIMAYPANHILQHIVLFELATRMLILHIVTYGVSNKQVAPRSQLFIAMTKFYDLNRSVKRKWQVEHIVTLISLRTLKKLNDPRLRNASLVEIKAKLEEISDLMSFPGCFRGPLKTLWRATCGPQAANCPPLA